jgi:hypothetical protein
MPNDSNPNAVAAMFSVEYKWDPTAQVVTRTPLLGPDIVGRVVARDVTAYSWYIDDSAAHRTVVVALTVNVTGTFGTTYNESVSLRFYPRVTATPAP